MATPAEIQMWGVPGAHDHAWWANIERRLRQEERQRALRAQEREKRALASKATTLSAEKPKSQKPKSKKKWLFF